MENTPPTPLHTHPQHTNPKASLSQNSTKQALNKIGVLNLSFLPICALDAILTQLESK